MASARRYPLTIAPAPQFSNGRPIKPDRTHAVMGRYATAAAALGKRLGLPVLDLYHLLQQGPDWGPRLLSDGLHLSPAGQEAVGRLVIELLERAYLEIRCRGEGLCACGVGAPMGGQRV